MCHLLNSVSSSLSIITPEVSMTGSGLCSGLLVLKKKKKKSGWNADWVANHYW